MEMLFLSAILGQDRCTTVSLSSKEMLFLHADPVL